MIESVPALLNEFGELLSKKHSPVIPMLLPGIEKEGMEKATFEIGLTLPEEVYELFGWKNGVGTPENFFLGLTYLFPLGGFFPFDNSIEAYKYYAGEDGYWEKSMFKLFESGGGEMYLIVCEKNSSNYGMIFKHSIGAVDYGGIIAAYDSLELLLKTVIEC